MSDDRVTAASDWLEFALGDLAASKSRPGNHALPRHVAYHAQQAVEKALKAALVLEGLDPPKVHDLDELRNLLPAGWQVKKRPASLSQLSDYAVDSRYPDFAVQVTPLQSAVAVRQAMAVVRLVREDFERRGISTADLRPR